MADNNDDSKDDLPLAFRAIRKPSLADYYAAGEALERFFTDTRGAGTAKLNTVAKRIGWTRRAMWELLKFHRFFTDSDLDDAKRSHATWSDLLRVMRKASGATLAEEGRDGFESKLEEAKERHRKREEKRANWDGAKREKRESADTP